MALNDAVEHEATGGGPRAERMRGIHIYGVALVRVD